MQSVPLAKNNASRLNWRNGVGISYDGLSHKNGIGIIFAYFLVKQRDSKGVEQYTMNTASSRLTHILAKSQ